MKNKYSFWADVMAQDTTVEAATAALLAKMGFAMVEFKEFPGGDCGCGCGQSCESFGSLPIYVVKYVDQKGVTHKLDSE